VRHDDADRGGCELAARFGVEQRLQIGALAGDQDADVHRRLCSLATRPQSAAPNRSLTRLCSLATRPQSAAPNRSLTRLCSLATRPPSAAPNRSLTRLGSLA